MATIAPPRARETDGTKTTPVRASRLGPPSLDALFTAFFALVGWGFGIQRLSDNSFFWHLRTGRLILDSGIPRTDPYSFSAPGTKWVAQSWLAELWYGVLDKITGPFGVRVFSGLLAAAISVLVFRLALRRNGDRVRAGLLSIAALAPLYTMWSARPLVIGVALFVLVLWVVEVPDSWVGRHAAIALPVIFWLWANVHGSFALGFAYLGLHLVGRWLDGHRPWEGSERALALGGIIGFVATFANPYGLALVKFPVDLLARGDILRRVVEWSSPDFHTARGAVFALWIAVFVGVVAAGRNRVTRRDLCVTVPFLLLGLWALRNVVIAPLVCVPVAAFAVRREPADASSGPRLRLSWVVAGVLALVTFSIGLNAAGQPDFRVRNYPERAMRELDRRGLLGRRLLTDDADGGYVILGYWPRQRVFYDDRFDMYPRSIAFDFLRVSDVRPGWRRVLEKHDIEIIVWRRSRALAQALRESDDWRVLSQDDMFVTFVRRNAV